VELAIDVGRNMPSLRIWSFWLANELPGSWGVIYWRDDEGEPRNAYRIMRIARGQVTWHDDTLLSPCNPVIED